MKYKGNFLTILFQTYFHDEMSVYAAQASFFIILAAFPFFMLLLCLINLTPFLQESDLLEGLVEIFPDNLDSLIITILHEVQTSTSTALISVSALTAILGYGMLSIGNAMVLAFYFVMVGMSKDLKELCNGLAEECESER